MGQFYARVKRVLKRSPFSWVVVFAGMSGITATLLASRLAVHALVGIATSFFVIVCLAGPPVMWRLIGEGQSTRDAILKQLSRILYHVRPISDIRGSVVKLREDAEARPAKFTHHRDVEPREDAPPASPSLFVPGSIPSIPIQARPDAHTPGRLAATQVPSGAEGGATSNQMLASLLGAPKEDLVRRVAVIGGESTPLLTSDGFDVEVLHPNLLPNACDSPFYCVVVDIAGLHKGPWCGLLSATHTSLFREVFDFLSDAKQAGSLVVVVDEATPDHFTSELEGLADIRIRESEVGELKVSAPHKGAAQVAFEADATLPIVDVIWEARKAGLQ